MYSSIMFYRKPISGSMKFVRADKASSTTIIKTTTTTTMTTIVNPLIRAQLLPIKARPKISMNQPLTSFKTNQGLLNSTKNTIHQVLKKNSQENKNSLVDIPLEWKVTELPDGVAFFTHPSQEEVIAVKQSREAQEQLLRRIAVSNPKEKDYDYLYQPGQRIRNPVDIYREIRQRELQQIKIQKLKKLNVKNVQAPLSALTPKQIQTVLSRHRLTPTEIEEIRALKEDDPLENTNELLSKKYSVSKLEIEQAAPTPTEKILYNKRISRKKSNELKKRKSRNPSKF